MKIIATLLLTLPTSLMMTSFAQAQNLPDDSIYHFESSWLNQESETVLLPDLAGHIQLVAFIYSYCEHTCPTIIATIKQVNKKLSLDAREQLRITLVSLDPDRDTPERLKTYMDKQSLDEEQWSFLHGDADDVQALSALFGVRYKPMGDSDIAHSNMLTILDQQGVMCYQMKGLGENLETITAEIEALAEESP